jgi:hypothetical protein
VLDRKGVTLRYTTGRSLVARAVIVTGDLLENVIGKNTTVVLTTGTGAAVVKADDEASELRRCCCCCCCWYSAKLSGPIDKGLKSFIWSDCVDNRLGRSPWAATDKTSIELGRLKRVEQARASERSAGARSFSVFLRDRVEGAEVEGRWLSRSWTGVIGRVSSAGDEHPELALTGRGEKYDDADETVS